MRCLTCHYDLSHLTEHRCPECGREFAPDDPKTYTTIELKREHQEKKESWVIALCFLVVLLLVNVVVRGFDMAALFVLLGGLGCLAVIMLIIVIARIVRARRAGTD